MLRKSGTDLGMPQTTASAADAESSLSTAVGDIMATLDRNQHVSLNEDAGQNPMVSASASLYPDGSTCCRSISA